MCYLFGILDYNHSLSKRQMNRLLTVLSTACEARGTDATGIAYNFSGRLRVYKRPLPAHIMRYNVPEGVNAVMGHTRMATQGSEKLNFNNHPFYGRANGSFALAHNGVIYNDEQIRKTENLPLSHIETDSYIAVQLIESKHELSFDSLKYMAEQLHGSMTITVLDSADNLYIVKGDNPLCLYHYPERGLYIYASTEEILRAGLRKLHLNFGKYEKVKLDSGEILRIDSAGKQTRSKFDDMELYYGYGLYPYHHGWEDIWSAPSNPSTTILDPAEKQYLDDMKHIAYHFGYLPDDIDELVAEGYTPDEIEEFLFA